MRRLALICAVFGVFGCSDGWLGTGSSNESQTYRVQGGDYEMYRPEGATGPAVFAVDVSKWAAEVTDAEVGCWYENGVRHVIVGTQDHRVAKQQIEEALEGGMSVDAYVYLYWQDDWDARVKRDLEFLKDYPIGRLWLDVEDHPGGTSITTMEAKIQQGLDACGETPCGIYTANWWWVPHMRNRDTFSHIPMWHAYYDEDPSLSTWDTQKFGGWELPWGKQWTETYFCGPRLDKNTMFINAEPVAPAKKFVETAELRAPVDLYPNQGMRINRDFVRALSDVVPGATRYDFEIQSYRREAWHNYFTFRSAIPAIEFTPSLKNRMYRFRVQAHRGDETSPWSTWSYFSDGNVTEMPEIPDAPAPQPEVEQPEPEPADPEPEPEPADPEPEPQPQPEPEPQPMVVPGAPTNLAPANASMLPNGAVTMSCNGIDSASTYAFEIEFWRASSQSWGAYFTYTGAANSRKFYPQADKAYRWRVVATTPQGDTPASAWQTFAVGSGQLP